jgi:hypothetical protein
MRILQLGVVLSILCAGAWGADVILNEYNAVDATNFLGGGDSSADESGGRASDSYFGRIEGNGGDWFELVVIKDHLNMGKWKLDLTENKKSLGTLELTNHAIWSDLRAGTIITVAEDVPSDISYNPAAGDWWINVQANDKAEGLYITAKSFKVTSNTWQLTIRNQAGGIVFGPAGEGVIPTNGISSTEVFRLEDDPGSSIARDCNDYDDGADFSTFGAPNRWGAQDFNDLRSNAKITPAAATIEVLTPSDPNVVDAGDIMTVRWKSTGIAETVLVEFSIDDGVSWLPVYPPNVGNSGQYKWLVPLVDSDLCLIRVSSSTRPAISDESDEAFVIVQSIPVVGLTDDFSQLVLAWLN